MKLEDIRENIDKIDDDMKELFKKRMSYSENVVNIKAKSGDVIYKPEREKDMIDRQLSGIDGSILAEYTSFLKAVVRISRQYQYKRLAELGKVSAGTDTYKADNGIIHLMLQTKDIAGILSIISDYGVKVLKINSSGENEEDDIFYIDIAADGCEKDVQALICQLSCETDKCVVMQNFGGI